LVEFVVFTPARHQFFVLALFDYPALTDNYNPVGMCDRG
jgi:hypothetical protein